MRSVAFQRKMGFATGVVKYFVFLANLVFALAGLTLIIIGVVYKLNLKNAINTLPSDFGMAPTLLIIVGAVVFITAFLGCCGAVKESTCMLTTYAIILLTIFIIQVALGVYAFLQLKDNDQRVKINEGLDTTFRGYSSSEEARETVDIIQKYLHCCGVRSSHEWTWPNGSIPASCCGNPEYSCSHSSPSVYERGCGEALYDFVRSSTKVVGGVAIGIAAAEVLGAVFALCLASSIRNSYRRGIYA